MATKKIKKLKSPKYNINDYVKYKHKEDGLEIHSSKIDAINIMFSWRGQFNRYILSNMEMIEEESIIRKIKNAK